MKRMKNSAAVIMLAVGPATRTRVCLPGSTLASFFSARGINIEDMATASYAAAHTGAPMFSVHMSVGIPADLHIAALRDEFMDFCDSMNLDAVLEPIKG